MHEDERRKGWDWCIEKVMIRQFKSD
jgi:hypothetical protein